MERGRVASLGARGHETRLDLCRLLVTQGSEGPPGGMTADRLGVLPPSLTFHLEKLRLTGLIAQRRFARQLIRYGTMNAALSVHRPSLKSATRRKRPTVR